MALEDKDIFTAICERFPDQPIEVIMEQYEKAKKINMDIEKRLAESENTGLGYVEIESAIPKRKFSRRDLVLKPNEAITEEYIACCLCGQHRQSLTKNHLAAHGISVEDYRTLCGYPQNLPLMSHKQLAVSRDVISRAQKARLQKRADMKAQ